MLALLRSPRVVNRWAKFIRSHAGFGRWAWWVRAWRAPQFLFFAAAGTPRWAGRSGPKAIPIRFVPIAGLSVFSTRKLSADTVRLVTILSIWSLGNRLTVGNPTKTSP